MRLNIPMTDAKTGWVGGSRGLVISDQTGAAAGAEALAYGGGALDAVVAAARASLSPAADEPLELHWVLWRAGQPPAAGGCRILGDELGDPGAELLAASPEELVPFGREAQLLAPPGQAGPTGEERATRPAGRGFVALAGDSGGNLAALCAGTGLVAVIDPRAKDKAGLVGALGHFSRLPAALSDEPDETGVLSEPVGRLLVGGAPFRLTGAAGPPLSLVILGGGPARTEDGTNFFVSPI